MVTFVASMLCLADAGTTAWWLRHGGSEANPFVAMQLDRFGIGDGLMLRVFVGIAAFGIAGFAGDLYRTRTGRTWPLRTVFGALGLLGAVVASNTLSIAWAVVH
jgi:hypothetical protein